MEIPTTVYATSAASLQTAPHPGGLWLSLAALTPLATAAYTGHGATGSAIPRAIRERTEACGGGRRTTGSILQAGAAPASDH